MTDESVRESVPLEGHAAPAPAERGTQRTTLAARGGLAATILGLQRSAGNAAVTAMLRRRTLGRRTLSRSILVIHGQSDNDLDRKITRNCLAALRGLKSGGHPAAPDAPRGKVLELQYMNGPLGPVFNRPPGKDFVAGHQTLYVLAHGSAADGTLGGLTAAEFAHVLAQWFGDQPYRGKIKLVSCTTAAGWDYDNAGRLVYGLVPIAKQIATALQEKLAMSPFQPASVDGVYGIAWVDERTGRILSIDLDHFMALINKLERRKRTSPFAVSPRGRGIREMETELGSPVEDEPGATVAVGPGGPLRPNKPRYPVFPLPPGTDDPRG